MKKVEEIYKITATVENKLKQPIYLSVKNNCGVKTVSISRNSPMYSSNNSYCFNGIKILRDALDELLMKELH